MKTKKLFATMLVLCMLASMFSGFAVVNAAVPENQRPSGTLSTNMIIGILNDSRAENADAFPNEPSVTGYTYYYLVYNNGNYRLSSSAWGANFSTNAQNYINVNAFWNDERIVRNSSGNAFGYYAPTGLNLASDPFFVTGFGASFPEEDIIELWMEEENLSGNASDYDLLFYVLKYETGWSSGYHLDAKVVRKNNVVLSYNANKPAGVTADVVLPASHSVAPNTSISVEDLGNNYKTQTANGLNYSFAGWNTKADGTGTAYAAGSTITVLENTILYAQWDVTNKYEVSWLNYNNEVLYSTDHTVSYGDPVPTYSETPTRPSDSTHTYTFSHWELIEGSYDAAKGVTEDLTYKAVYTDERITYKATVAVVLNGAFDQDGNPDSTNPGTLVDISTVTASENKLYLKTAEGTTYITLEKESTGVYSSATVSNGNYLIYKYENGTYIQVGTQALSINNANRTRYLPYYSVTYLDGSANPFHKAYYYIGSEVDVITEVPTKDDHVFVNWKDGASEIYTPSTALQTVDLTDSIIKGYELTAQWELAAKVSVTVVADHNGRAEDPTADLTLHLTKKDAGDDYNQVADTAVVVPAAQWFDNNLTATTYAAGVVYADLDPTADYAAHAAIPGYRSDTERSGGAIEINYDSSTKTYAVTLYLIYDPDGYELPFTVAIDPNIEDRFVPEAVDVKVTRLNEMTGVWEVIPQHVHQSVEVAIDKTTRQGTGKVHVWGFNGSSPYLYRIEVIRVDLGAYQIDMAVSTDHINYISKESGFFPAGAYTAEVMVDSHLPAGEGLKGAHADKSGEALEHHGSIVATVTALPYTISLDPNGGVWGDQSTDAETIENRFTVPNLADYTPTWEGHTFAGWALAGSTTAVKAGDAVKAHGITVGGTLALEAVWNNTLTVKGDVVVDLGYPCDDASRQVLVILQRREGEDTYYVTADDIAVSLTPQSANFAKGSYIFADVPNLDSYHYRIDVVVAGGGTVLYQNEPASTASDNDIYDKTKYAADMYVAAFGGDTEAVVNIYMEAEPFALGYMADVSAISETFRPENLTLDLWHDHMVGGVEEFHRIVDLMYFGTFTDGVSAIETKAVPPYHANGQLYDYAISVLSYTIPEMGITDRHYYHDENATGYTPSPFAIHYEGPAGYSETPITVDGTAYNQDVILKAIFRPNTYHISYELNSGSWAAGTTVPTHHTWSFKTDIPTPIKAGHIFTGWTVTPLDTAQTDIYDETGKYIKASVWTDVTFTANWKEDTWTDGTPDSQDVGDEIPDDEQIRILYVSANSDFGTVEPALEIVTLAGTVPTAAATATPTANHEFVRWTCENVIITNPENAALSQSFTATGGETYVFVAEFKAVDHWHDTEDQEDKPDTIPDVQQVKVTYRSANLIGGAVSKAMDIFTLESSGNINVANVTATANSGYEFTGWRCEKITFQDATPTLNHTFPAVGGETYEFIADFAPIDKWNADDNTDTPDGTPDMYQVKIHFESANPSMGTVSPNVDVITIPGAVSSGTVRAESKASASSGHRFVNWTHEGNQVGTKAALSHDFAATGGTEYTFVAEFKTSGGGGGGGTTLKYTLSYESNGGTQIATEKHTAGITVTINKTPKKEGHIFEGWYADQSLTSPVDKVKMTQNITVYAKWVKDNGSAGSGYDTPGSLNGEDHFAYVVGYPDGTVRPNAHITRAEVTAIFFRLLKPDAVRDKNLTNENAFTDVNQTDWYNTSISTMAKLGIVNGRTAELFAPNENITRAEFATICARFDDSEFEIVDTFTDVNGHWAESDIHEAASHGWIRGYEDGTFKPNQLITRAEAMTMINRVLNRAPEEADDLLADMTTWPDNSDPSAWYYLAVQEATNSHTYDMKNHIYEKWTALKEGTDWMKYQ